MGKIYRNQTANSKKRGMALPNYSKDWLLEYAKNSVEFIDNYMDWVDNDYDKKLTPSFDRIDNDKSYTKDNIQATIWIKNKNRQHQDVIDGKYISALQRCVIAINEKSGEESEHYSIRSAARHTGVDFRNVSACCRGERRSGGGYLFMYKEDYCG